MYPKFTRVRTSKQAFERVHSISDFGYAVKTDEGAGADYDTRINIGSKDYTPEMWRLSFAITDQGGFTDVYGVLKNAAPDLAKSLVATREQHGANLVLNNAFTTTGIDTKTLSATDHPLKEGTASNRGDGTNDLSLTVGNAETALVQLMGQVTHRGIPSPATGPFDAWFEQSNYPLAVRIYTSSGLQGTADNDVNFVKGIVTPRWNPFFTATAPWCLITQNKEDHELHFIERIPLFTRMWTDNETLQDKVTMGEEYIIGFFDWRGYWATSP
jgi:hypothetical protein